MEPLKALGVAYKFMEFYVGHLPKTQDDWKTLSARANEIVGDDDFACKIMSIVLDKIEEIAVCAEKKK